RVFRIQNLPDFPRRTFYSRVPCPLATLYPLRSVSTRGSLAVADDGHAGSAGNRASPASRQRRLCRTSRSCVSFSVTGHFLSFASQRLCVKTIVEDHQRAGVHAKTLRRKD